MPSFSARDLALHLARLLDGKGQDLMVLQQPVGAQSFDFVVLATASSERLAYHLVEEAWHFCKRHNVARHPIEGESGWMLIDCYEVVVHALSPEAREKYQLEDLWKLARKIDWQKELKALADPDKPEAAPKKSRTKKVAEPEVEVEAVVPEVAPKKKPAARKKKAVEVVEVVEEAPAEPKKRKTAPRVARGDNDTKELPKLEPAALTKRKSSLTRKKAR